jgi:3-deoxy-D-manno-octulosonic-acid transferase
VAYVGEGADGAARATLDALWTHPDRRIVVGGSTWPGEERALLAAVGRLGKSFGGLRLVLAPRHAERSAEVAEEIRRAGFTLARRSELAAGRSAAPAPDVLLVDTTGELAGFYACADAAFVGKSLTAHGGQNFIEPAVFGTPFVVGPNLENFPVVADMFRAADAMIVVRSQAELEEALRGLLADEDRRRAFGARARGVVDAGRGVVSRSVDLILPVLDGGEGA